MKLSFSVPPSLVGDQYESVTGAILAVPAPGLLANDSNVNGASVTLINDGFPIHEDNIQVNPDGSFSYTPSSDYVGTDAFHYRVTTSQGTADSGAFIIIWNYLESVTLDSTVVSGGSPITGTVKVRAPSDHSGYNAGFLYQQNQPGNPIAGRVDYLQKTGTFSIPSSIVSTPTVVPITLKLDGSNSITVYVTLAPPPPIPTAVADFYTVAANSGWTGVPPPGLLGNDIDAVGATMHFLNTTIMGFGFDANTGAISYLTPPNFIGTEVLQYFARNASGDSNVATATFQVVNAVKNVQSDAPSFRWGSQITGTVTLEVADPNNPTTVTLSDNHGNVLAEGVQVVVPSGAIASTFSVSTQPSSSSQSVTISATINNGSNVTKSVSVNMTPVPVGVPDNYLAAAGTTLSVPAQGVLVNDQYGTLPGSRVAQLLQTTTRGSLSLNANGGFTYTPFNNLTGSDAFIYRPNTSSGILGTPTSVTIQVRNRLFKIKTLNNPTGGTPVQAYVELISPSVGTTTVILLESTPLLFGNGMPVTIPNGAKQSAVFNVSTAAVTTNTTVSLSATLNNGTPDVSAAVTIKK